MAPIALTNTLDSGIMTPESEREEDSPTNVPLTGVGRFKPLPYVKTILVTGDVGFM